MTQIRQIFILLFIIYCFIECEADNELNGVRGVSPQLASFYTERLEFECIDGSKKIPYEQVNDDYCDCDDGSDEPGTSACSDGKFYCLNVGYRPLIIPSSNVNDFVCDCCDGSDEWNSDVDCPNLCQVQGEKWRQEVEENRLAHRSGYDKRVELSQLGVKKLEEKKIELEKIKAEYDELELLKVNVEAKKNEVESREREAKEKFDSVWNVIKEEHRHKKDVELFSQINTNNDAVISVSEFEAFGKLKGQITEENIKDIFGEQAELTLDSFKAVSQKVRDLLKNLLKFGNSKKSEEQLIETTDETSNQSTTDESVHEDAELEESEAELNNEVNKDDDELQQPPYDEVTQTLINEADLARQEWDDILKKVSDNENNIKNFESLLNFDYGEDKSWVLLKGQCVEFINTQYIYHLCLFDRAIQKDRNGHSEVNLGYWNNWIGPESNKYSAQLYDKGQGCWNGPERLTHVDIQCGVDIKLIEVSEPSKCEYRFVLKTPTACKNLTEIEHEEL